MHGPARLCETGTADSKSQISGGCKYCLGWVARHRRHAEQTQGNRCAGSRVINRDCLLCCSEQAPNACSRKHHPASKGSNAIPWDRGIAIRRTDCSAVPPHSHACEPTRLLAATGRGAIMNTSMQSAFAGTQLGAKTNGSRVNMLFKRVRARSAGVAGVDRVEER